MFLRCAAGLRTDFDVSFVERLVRYVSVRSGEQIGRIASTTAQTQPSQVSSAP